MSSWRPAGCNHWSPRALEPVHRKEKPPREKALLSATVRVGLHCGEGQHSQNG